MWNKPSEHELRRLPALYSTEDVPLKEKMIYMHFFIGGCDWYAAEYDPENRIFFGFVILNNDLQNAEWGYFSLDELADLKFRFIEVDCDLYFTPRKAKSIEKIRKASAWKEEVLK